MSEVLEQVNLEEIRMKLQAKLNESHWGPKLKSFILSSDFMYILTTLLNNAQEGKRFTPPIKNIFQAFYETDYNNLKVVMMMMDPYKVLGVSSGVATDCRNTGREELSLRMIFDEINRTVYPGEAYNRDVNLSRWGAQGVLMLNSSLTTEVGESGKHKEIWKSFTTFLMDMLNNLNSGLIFVFAGKDAQKYNKFIDPIRQHYVFNIYHPAAAGHNNSYVWDSEDVFNKINKILWDNNKEKIIW